MCGGTAICPQAGGRSQTHQRSISGMSPPALHSTTDPLPPATNMPRPTARRGLRMTCVINWRSAPSRPLRRERVYSEQTDFRCVFTVVLKISSPRQRPSSLISDSSVEPVPSPSESYLSSSPASTTLFNDVPPSGPNPNISAAKVIGVSLPVLSCPSLDVCLHLPLCVHHQELKDYPVYPDPSLKAFEGATLRYASLKLKYSPTQSFILLSPPTKCLICVHSSASLQYKSSQLDSHVQTSIASRNITSPHISL